MAKVNNKDTIATQMAGKCRLVINFIHTSIGCKMIGHTCGFLAMGAEVWKTHGSKNVLSETNSRRDISDG